MKLAASQKHVRKSKHGEPKRIAILNPARCKPKSPAYDYLKKVARACGKDCIQVNGKKIKISEDACSACIMRAKRCPDNAVRVVQLPAGLSTATHSFGLNFFKLHGLPLPKPGKVTGLLGVNGTGKSTVLKILAGHIKPNLSVSDDTEGLEPPSWEDIIKYYRGNELQLYFKNMLEDRLTVAIKPQLDGGPPKRLAKEKVGDVLKRMDERGKMDEISTSLDLNHLHNRKCGKLSGGEIQRLAVACTCLQNREVYMFDEPSAFLDIRQRINVMGVIRSLLDEDDGKMEDEKTEDGEGEDATKSSNKTRRDRVSRKYVIVVDHDLSVLDYVSDNICCMFGEAGAFGCVSKPYGVGQGINNFLAGYLPAENVRFRSEPLKFRNAQGLSDSITAEAATHDSKSRSSAGAGGTDGKKTKTKSKGLIDYPDGRIELLEKTKKKKKKVKKEKATTAAAKPTAAKPTAAKTTTSTVGENKTKTPAPKVAFTLNIEAGAYRSGEIVGLLGENGCGKSTFMKHLSEKIGTSVSYKLQHFGPKLKKFEGTVEELLEAHINTALSNRFFRLHVLTPLDIKMLGKTPVKALSGGQLQRIAIVLCLGTPADVYLLDEPSAFLDCEQRALVTKVMRSWIITHLGKAGFIIEHDILMASALYDRVITFEGEPGVECNALTPVGLETGFNRFLTQLRVTLRRDPTNFRPRINKKNSALDRKQKAADQYFLLTEDE